MKTINCTEIANELKEKLKKNVSLCNFSPSLTVIQVGDNQASNSYIGGKRKDCEEVGINCNHIKLNEDITTEGLVRIISELNENNEVNGIIVQLPLPKHINETEIINQIAIEKDVDGFRLGSGFTSCTPKGIMTIIDALDYELSGKHIVIAGRSNIVGKPVAKLFLDRDCTVSIVHSKSKERNIKLLLESADVFVSAIGKAKHFKVEDLKNIDIVIDVGINRDDNGKLCGDIDLTNIDELDKYNTMITPVPKGVGLLTRVSLLENTLESYNNRRK